MLYMPLLFNAMIMKTLIYSSLLAACLLVGCNIDDPHCKRTPGTETEDATVVISFASRDMTIPMESLCALDPEQEQALKDINLYLFNKSTGICVRHYIKGTSPISMELEKGDYDIYAIANYGSNIGEQTKNGIENFTVSITSEHDLEKDDVLPMSCYESVTVHEDMNLSLILKRRVAKIDVTVNLSEEMSRILTLQSLRMVNAPFRCRYFGKNVPTVELMEYPRQDCKNGQQFTFYVLENMQGVNNTITDPKLRGGNNAPANGTYLHIEGYTANKLLDYCIYLGCNTTTDFNMTGNCNYSLEINIQGQSDLD